MWAVGIKVGVSRNWRSALRAIHQTKLFQSAAKMIPVLSLTILATIASAASLTQISDYGSSAKSKAGMYVYVPDNVVANPPLVVVIHSCQSSATSYFGNSLIPWHKGSDGKGYITIWPSSPNSGTCWDVSSKASLSHGGGGDSNAIVNMVTYAITKYKADATKVYVTGGSSGGKLALTLILE
jgi:acetylxylan esterase